MSYAKSWWVPNEEEVGQTWRNIYNLYLKGPIDFNTVNLIIQNNKIKLDKHEVWFPATIEGACLLHNEYGDIIYQGLEKRCPNWMQKSLCLFLMKGDLDAYYSINWYELEAHIGNWRFLSNIYKAITHKRLLVIIKQVQSLYANPRYSKTDLDRLIFCIMMRNYENLCDLKAFRNIAVKTWGDQNKIRMWSEAEFNVLNKHFEDCKYTLESPDPESGIDPEEIDFGRYGLEPVMGMSDSAYVLRILLTDFAWDFADELLLFNRHKSVKGSATCEECAQVFPKSFYGRHQKYCSIQCKMRAAKRRQREKDKRKGLLI